MYTGFTHSGKISYWDVPAEFKFPMDAGCENGFRLWIVGMPDFEVKVGNRTRLKPIKPFREFQLKQLPVGNNIKSQYMKAWAPLFRLMEEGIDVPANPTSLSADKFNALYKAATEHIKKRCSFIWLDSKKWKNHGNWGILTWAKNTSRSITERFGSEEDKAQLPAAASKNKAKPAG